MSKKNMINCKACGKEIAKGVKKCVHCGKDQRNFFMRHKIFTGILAFVILIIAVNTVGGDDDQKTADNGDEVATNEEEATKEANNEDSVEVDKKEKTKEEKNEKEKEEDVPREFTSALKKAEQYANSMHMSKAGVYDQLVSEHGEDFPEDAAQYAIDNLEADWKENALKKAKTYADEMAMSDSAVYDQLVSDHGEQFTEEEAQYGVDNLD